jgi:hypothetical protein
LSPRTTASTSLQCVLGCALVCYFSRETSAHKCTPHICCLSIAHCLPASACKCQQYMTSAMPALFPAALRATMHTPLKPMWCEVYTTTQGGHSTCLAATCVSAAQALRAPLAGVALGGPTTCQHPDMQSVSTPALHAVCASAGGGSARSGLGVQLALCRYHSQQKKCSVL